MPRPFSDVYETRVWTLTAREQREVERRRRRHPEPGRWLIGYKFVCLESFRPQRGGMSPRLDPGVYEVVSFWDHGPILGLSANDGISVSNSIGLEWREVEEYGQLYSPEQWARRATHAPKPTKVPKKKAVKKRAKQKPKKPPTLWDRLGEEP